VVDGTPASGPPPPAGTGARPTRSQLQRARDVVPVGAWDWNINAGDLVWDQAMHLILGTTPETFDGRIETWRSLIQPEDLPVVLAQAEQSLRDGADYHVRHRVRRPDGTVATVEVRGRIVTTEHDATPHMVGRLWETAESSTALDPASRALRHMSDAFVATDSEWRILYANIQAELLLGSLPSPRGAIGRTLWETAAAHVPGLESRCRRVVAERTPAGLDLQLPRGGRWYHLRLIPVPDGLTLYLTDITEKRQLEAERAAAQQVEVERAKHIAELTAALVETLTARDVVAAVAERVLPLFDASGLVVQATDGDRVRAVWAAGYPQPFLARLAEGLPTGNPAGNALRDGAPRFVVSPEQMKADYPGMEAVAALSGKRAWAFLPLMISSQPVGICIVSFDRPRTLSGEERTLLIALSGLIAQALERARQYDAEHSRAQALQRGLLPSALPDLPAVTTAARYLPASASTLGGDWYDVIALSADRVALVIGDVMGHGLPEAATMGRLRTAVRTLASLELPPDELLSHLNDIVTELGDDFYATCLYALYDPVTGACTFADAGHPQPALVHPEGTVRFLDLAANPPLGAATAPFETVEMILPEGSLLVLYTDGFVESAQRDIDSGLDQLATALTTDLADTPDPGDSPRRPHTGADTEAARLALRCDALVSALLPSQQLTTDDAAVLVARTRLLPAENVASWTLADGPRGAREARVHIRHQLAEWQLDELVTTTELLASELVGNVVRHANGPARLRLLRSRTLICEVSDGSLTTPRIRHPRETDEGGRGLQLVAALSQRWGTRYTAEGKCIWTEQPL